MPLILRVIQRGRWRTGPGLPDLAWLPPGEIQAQALLDLRPENNRLSVWQVADDRANLDRILIALASTRDGLFHVDYALLDEALLAGIPIRLEQTPGASLDAEANVVWHFDLVELTVSKVAALSRLILERAEKQRCMDRAIGNLLAGALTTGQVDSSHLREGLRVALDRRAARSSAEGRPGADE